MSPVVVSTCIIRCPRGKPIKTEAVEGRRSTQEERPCREQTVSCAVVLLVSWGLQYRHLARYVACSTHPRCRCGRLKYAKHDAERLAQGGHPICTFFDGDRRCDCSSTMEHYDGPPGTLTAPIHSWTNGDSSVFRVRGRNYIQDRLKVVPGEPLGNILH